MEEILTPGFGDMSVAELKKLSTRVLSEWIYQNREFVLAEINQRLSSLLKDTLPDTSADQQCLRYGSELISGRTDLDLYANSYLLLRTIDAATRHKQISCHKVFFGETREVALFGHPAAFLTALDQVRADQMFYALSVLENGKNSVNNAEYVIKLRLDALASFMGKSLNSLLNASIAKTRYSQGVRRFVIGIPDPVVPSFSRKADFVCSATALHILLFCSVVSDLPVDYFLMLDYSDIASLDGHPLSGIQKSLLSSYLKANEQAQKKAMQYLLNCIVLDDH